MSVDVNCLYSIVICQWMLSIFTVLSYVSGCYPSLQYCHMSVDAIHLYSIVICQWMLYIFTVLPYVSGYYPSLQYWSYVSGCDLSLQYCHMSVDAIHLYSIVTGQWMFSVFIVLSHVSGRELSLLYCHLSVDIIHLYSIFTCQWT